MDGVPYGRQISCKTQQNFLVWHWHGLDGNVEFLQLRFELVDFRNSPFQRASNSAATRRLSGSTASYRRDARCAWYRVCSTSSSSTLPLFLSLLAHLLGCFERRLDCIPANRMQHFTRYCLIGPKTAERNTPVLPMIHVCAFAVVTKHGSPDTGIRDVEHSTATTASQHSGQ